MQNRTNTSSSPYNFYPKNLVEEIDQLTVKRHEIEKRGSKVELSLQEEIRRVVRSLHDVRPPHMGDTVAGAELIDIIGSGNFGDVWEAKDNASGQKVAVKIFHANKMGLGQNLHYFRRGVEAMDKLTHCKGRPESVIELLYVDPSRLAFSMPLVPRTDLSKTIKSWSVEKKIVFFKTLCDAVKFAHANQILHRDVKPENILVTEDLRPVLTDFDICDLLYKKTLSTQATGTVVYASPEQLMGTNERSFSSDVYSLGRILHFLLLEKHPDLLHEKLPRLDDLQGKPECLVRIIRRCTQFEPERRYQTVDELLVDIKKCEVNLETAEVGIPSVADSAKPPRNWFKDATIVAAIIGAITLVITTAMPLIFNDSKKQTDKPSMTLVQQPSKPQADTTINTTAKSPELKSEIQIAPNTIDPKETTASRGGYVLVGIPGGKFPMGINSENVPHPVQIKPFYLGKYEVTVEEYGLFLKANPDDSKNKPDDWDDQIRNPKLPVTKVSWNDAQAYCKWAGLRLPSEAEWEWTARAGTATRFWSGDKDADLKRAGWYNGNSDGRLHTVGEKEPNPFGLFDMHGNIWEWVEDDWHYDYSGAPTDGSAWVNKQWAVFRVARGGSFGFDAVNCRSATRNRVVPGLRNDNLGFRPARSIP
jgi:formylglycine-generating enzyme required for sulfatase activity/tRNA A-37 threonylcarbamoyl transferase component Bud32